MSWASIRAAVTSRNGTVSASRTTARMCSPLSDCRIRVRTQRAHRDTRIPRSSSRMTTSISCALKRHADRRLPSPPRTWTKPQTKPKTESLKNDDTPQQALSSRVSRARLRRIRRELGRRARTGRGSNAIGTSRGRPAMDPLANRTPRLVARVSPAIEIKPSDGLEPSTRSLPWKFKGLTSAHAT